MVQFLRLVQFKSRKYYDLLCTGPALSREVRRDVEQAFMPAYGMFSPKGGCSPRGTSAPLHPQDPLEITRIVNLFATAVFATSRVP